MATLCADSFEINIELNEVRPKVWRRIVVPSGYSLSDLHQVIQIAMGWMSAHAHQFSINGTQYSSADLEDVISTPITIKKAFELSPNGFEYVYDMGDFWRHSVTLVSPMTEKEASFAPICLGGAGACPPEDVGGSSGYTDFLRAISDPSDQHHKEWLDWAGGPFDPDGFIVSQATAGLIAWRLGRQ